MNTSLYKEVKGAINNWWMSLVLGILFIGVAFMLMFMPLEGYVALSIIFSVTMFLCGIFEIAFAVSNKKVLSGWGWYLAGGIIDLILGLLLMCIPALAMGVIPFLVAFWLMFRGFTSAGYSIDLQKLGTNDWGWYLVFGILAILCSFAIIFNPALGALSTIYITAFAFLFIGVFRIMLSFELKRFKGNAKELKEKIEEIKGDIK